MCVKILYWGTELHHTSVLAFGVWIVTLDKRFPISDAHVFFHIGLNLRPFVVYCNVRFLIKYNENWLKCLIEPLHCCLSRHPLGGILHSSL